MENAKSYRVLIVAAGIALFLLAYAFRKHDESVSPLFYWGGRIVFAVTFVWLCSRFESLAGENWGSFQALAIYLSITLIPGGLIILLDRLGPVPFLPF